MNDLDERDVRLVFYDESSDLVKNNQDSDLNDNKLTNLDSITVNRNLTSDNEVANKKYIDDELNKNTIVTFQATLQNYLKVTVGNNTYSLTKYERIQTTDTTIIQFPNVGGYLLQNWNIERNDKNNNGKVQNFIRSTKTNSPTGDSGATSPPPVGDSFMYIETGSNNHGSVVFVSW